MAIDARSKLVSEVHRNQAPGSIETMRFEAFTVCRIDTLSQRSIHKIFHKRLYVQTQSDVLTKAAERLITMPQYESVDDQLSTGRINSLIAWAKESLLSLSSIRGVVCFCLP